MTEEKDHGASLGSERAGSSVAPSTHPTTVPVRVQRLRAKGWKMPENTVYVGRPTIYGNPFRIGSPGPDDCMVCADAEEAVMKFRSEIVTFGGGFTGLTEDDIRRELRGKNLACWCPLDQPCHADVLLEIANGNQASEGTSGSLRSAAPENHSSSDGRRSVAR